VLSVASPLRFPSWSLSSTSVFIALSIAMALPTSRSEASTSSTTPISKAPGADHQKLAAQALQPPTGWIELKAIAPVQRLWIHQVTSRSVADSSLFAIQAHSARDEKILKLKRQLEAWHSANTVPDLSPLQVDGASLEAFELREPATAAPTKSTQSKDSATESSTALSCATCCYTFRASSNTPNRPPTAWRQTWCFTSRSKALVAIERGTDRISARERLQLLELESTLQHSSTGSQP
jgi:hypothetical protein